jgi:hypothetical protein
MNEVLNVGGQFDEDGDGVITNSECDLLEKGED